MPASSGVAAETPRGVSLVPSCCSGPDRRAGVEGAGGAATGTAPSSKKPGARGDGPGAAVARGEAGTELPGLVPAEAVEAGWLGPSPRPRLLFRPSLVASFLVLEDSLESVRGCPWRR